MSENLNYNININVNDSAKQVDNLNSKIADTGKKTAGAGKEAKTASGAFSSIGSSLKSLGIITVIVKALEFLQEILMENSKISNLLTTSMNFLTGVFTDLADLIVEKGEKLIKILKDVFENPKKYIDQLGTAIKNNIQERIASAIEAFGYLGDIIKNVFTGEFDAAKESAKKFGKEMLDVATGIDDVFDKTSAAVTELADEAEDYFKKKWKQAQELTDATEAAAIAEAKMTNAIKQTEIAAEKLRQKRDDETVAIKERIKANDELSKVLEKGQKQELALLAVTERKIRAEIALKGKSKETEIELIKLEGQRADIREKYTSRASEQLINRIALLREELNINNLLAASENKILLERQKANAELIKDEVRKVIAKKGILEEESKLELNRLRDSIYLTNLGTASRAEAEIAYNEKVAQLAIDNNNLDMQLQIARYNRDIDQIASLRTNLGVEYEIRKLSIDAELILEQERFKKGLTNTAEYNNKLNALTQQRISYIEAEKKAQQDYAVEIGNILGQVSQLFDKSTAASKVAALAEVAIQTGVGFARGLQIAQQTAAAKGPGAAYAFPIFYASQIAAVLGAANRARSIINTGSTSGGGVALNPSTPPITPRQEQVITTSLSQSSINALGNTAIRAYVVETDITTNQKRIEAIKQRARFS